VRFLAETSTSKARSLGSAAGSAGFVGGLKRFVEGLRAPIRMLEKVDSGYRGAALYDADLPRGDDAIR